MKKQSMSAQSVAGGVVIATVALALLALFVAPVLGNARAGYVGSLTGNADASAAMVYAMLGPMLLTLARGFVGRLLGLGAATALAFATRAWVDLVEVEALGLALALLVGCLSLVVVALLLVRVAARRQRGKVATVAWSLARATSQVTEHLRRRYGGSAENGRAGGPLNQVLLVETLVFNILAAAEPESTPRDFAASVLDGLAELRDGLAANTVTDPHGYAAAAAAEYSARLSADLRRLVPGASAPVATNRAIAAA